MRQSCHDEKMHKDDVRPGERGSSDRQEVSRMRSSYCEAVSSEKLLQIFPCDSGSPRLTPVETVGTQTIDGTSVLVMNANSELS